MDTQVLQQIQQKTDELLTKLGIAAQSTVEWDESEVVQIKIEPRDENGSLGHLIGYRGETLRSFQLILSLMINRDQKDWLKLWVDADGYRAQQEEKLRQLARRTAEKALFLKEPVALAPMPAADRRVVHLTVAEIPQVSSESVEQDSRRRVIIKPQE